MFAELVELGKRVRKGNDALKEEKCSWDIVIDEEGNFIDLIPCDIIIEAEKLSSKKGKARLLLDKPEETLGLQNAKDKHETYIAKLNDYKEVQALSPVFQFYNKPEEIEKALNAFINLSSAKQQGNMTFMVDSVRLVSIESVKEAIERKYDEHICSKKQETLCAICGTNIYPVIDEPHGSVKLPKGQSSGSMLVSYNNNAFESYNLKGNLNSGICTNCARNYVEALTFLTMSKWLTNDKGKKYKKYDNAIELSDDTLVLFWTKEPIEEIDPFSDICQPTAERVRKLFSSIASDKYQQVDREVVNYFYSCTISSAAARIAVRDWTAISISQYQKNLKQWFEDIVTVKNGDTYYPGINTILNNCLKKKTKPTQSDAKAKARIGTILWHAALTNTSLPIMILKSVLTQIEHDYFSPEKSTIIRLVLNRNIKNKYYMKNELDNQNESIAYLCGRLFALICKLQFKAQGEVNNSIKDRFFASASNMPGRVMGILLTQYVPVYQKKTRGAYTKAITEIAARIGHFPDKLTLSERGEFALGYYYQYGVKQIDNYDEINELK